MTNAKKIENLQKGLANIRDYIARCEEANREGVRSAPIEWR